MTEKTNAGRDLLYQQHFSQAISAGDGDLLFVLIDSKVQHNCGSPVREKDGELPTAIGEPLRLLKNHSFMDIRGTK